MPATSEDYKQVKKYQDKANQKNLQGADAEATASTLWDTVMKSVREDRTTRGVSKLATDVGNVMGQMVADPTGIRERTSSTGMVDPSSVNALTSEARLQNLRTLGTVSTQERLNQGSLDEVIQAGANQLKARAQMLYAQAQKDAAKAQALQQQLDYNLRKKAQEFSQKMELQRFDLQKKNLEPSYSSSVSGGTKSTSGTRSRSSSGSSRAKSGSKSTSRVTSSPPMYTPVGGMGTVSNNGDWVFSSSGWVENKKSTAKSSIDKLKEAFGL
jgi:hypothetical protein